jgi:AcrR family transcriptional regulator
MELQIQSRTSSRYLLELLLIQKFASEVATMVRELRNRGSSPHDSDDAAPRKPNMREAILCAAEELFSTNGFNAVSVRDIAQAAGANPGSVTYHFKTKDGLLLEIYRRHCGPMNLRRSELLAAARRVRDLNDRLEAIVRAYVVPAFSSGSDLAGGGVRFTRLRAVMSAEGNAVAAKIIAQTFDDTSHAFIDTIHESLPHIPRTEIVWRSHFLLGALYYSLVTPERVSRLARGEADGSDSANAIEQLVRSTVASLQAPALEERVVSPRPSAAPSNNTRAPTGRR